MTPKDRRQQQYRRELETRGETEAAIEEFRAGRRLQRPTILVSRRKTRKQSARCDGCDASGFPLEVWEYHDVESGPAILCDACSAVAERTVRTPARIRSPKFAPGHDARSRRSRD